MRDGVSEISIHIPRVGDDAWKWTITESSPRFQSTSPVWGMTCQDCRREYWTVISIHIPRVGDDDERPVRGADYAISIHIPRVGDDEDTMEPFCSVCDFNPHPPCGG